MQTKEKFWDEDKKAVAKLCEKKGCVLLYDVLQEMYYVVLRMADGSVYHSKDVRIFKSHDIAAVEKFMNYDSPKTLTEGQIGNIIEEENNEDKFWKGHDFYEE